jgi:hypothetical protein
VDIVSMTDLPLKDIPRLAKRLIETAEFLDGFFTWSWTTRDRNPRGAAIAEPRWEIRNRTGRPHDPELAALIDAAFRAAGHKEGFWIDATALDRIEKREKEGRVKAARRLRSRVNRHSPSK